MSGTPYTHRLLADIPELHAVQSGGIVRLPEVIGVPFSPRVQAIVDHPHFQRLRKVRQLSLTYLVYPGAVHTRFEHSLGVFQTASHYIRALLTDPRAAEHLENVPRGCIESLLVASLLHDIGHYPFAHLMEDLYGEVADHVDLVMHFLTGDICDMYESLLLPEGVPPLGDVLCKHWPDVDFADLCYFVSGDTGGDAYRESERAGRAILRSVLDGSIDADKMDYLYRDSIHCGVPYGRFIDRDRFFQALTVADGRPDTIAVHEKGRIGVELFAYARSAMYSEVYWHHASRSITAMLNRAIREATSGDPPMDQAELMNIVFGLSDEETVAWLANNGGGACGELMGLINRRQLYKRLLVLQRPVQQTLFDMLDHVKWDSAHNFDSMQDRFIERVNESGIWRLFGSEPLASHDILIDVPHRRSGLDDVPIIRERSDRFSEAGEPVNVWNGIKQDFERWVRKIRVFIHPARREALERAIGDKEPDPTLHDRLVNLLTECAWEAMQKPSKP